MVRMQFSVDIRHPYRFLSTKFGRYKPPSNDMPDLEDLPFGNMICFISCCLAVFGNGSFFSSHENLTIANWYDFWNVFTFTNPMSRSAVSWGMVRGYNFWVPIWCPCDQRGCCYFNDLDWKKRLPVLVGEKGQPNGQRMCCLSRPH